MKLDAEAVATTLGAWAAGAGPLHARLGRALASAADRGELPPGATLPTERDLARRLAVSRTTVVAAYRALKEAGTLASRQGRGTWVTRPARPGPADGAHAFSAELFAGILSDDPGLIDMSAACPRPASCVAGLAGDAASWPASALAGSGYRPAGLPELRAAIAARLTGDGLPTAPEEVLVTSGAQQGVVLAAALLGEPGETALVEEVTYPAGLDVLRARGLRPIGVPIDADGVVPEALERLAARVRPRLAYLVPRFQNPTGVTVTAARARRIAEMSAEYRLPVVADHTLEWLSLRDEAAPPPIAAWVPEAPVITIGSLSKVLWGGLRIGWMRARPAEIERLTQLKLMSDLGSAVPAQALACRLLPHLDAAIAEKRGQLALAYEALAQGLATHCPGWTWDVPRGGPTLWARLPGGDARTFAQMAQRAGVAVLPGPVLSADGAHGDRLRLPFVHDPATLAEATRRLGVAWQAYSGGGVPRRADPAVVV
jgi:DNA-binding transcriptional MocR family regulator